MRFSPLPTAVSIRALLFAGLFLAPAGSLALAADAPAPAQAPALELAPAGDPVVARVNGTEIRRSDLVATQHQLPPQMQNMPLETLYPQLITQAVNVRLLVEQGKTEKLGDTPEVKARLAGLQDRLIEEAYIDRLLASAVTDDKLHAEYQKTVQNAPAKEEIKARHILVPTEDAAKAVIAALDKGGDFAKLADEKNAAGAAGAGGDLGWFNHDQMVPEFTEAAFKLKKGEYTKVPVKTQFGYHVILVEDRRESKPPTFEEAKDNLTEQLQRATVEAKLKELRGSAKIEQFQLDGTPIPTGSAPVPPAH